MASTHFDHHDKTALVTGASTGIGAEFARELAQRGARLVLVARNETRLEAVANELRLRHGTKVTVLPCDLARSGAIAELARTLDERNIDVDVLVNNAGYGGYGRFEEQSLAQQRGQVDLNVAALVDLSHTFVPSIVRRRGGIIHVASTAAFQPVPYMAVYAATKAFVLSFSEALWGEYRNRGVRVLALCPGATDTPFFDRAGPQAALGPKASPRDVVRLGLAAFDRNRCHVVHGRANRWLARLSRVVSRAQTVRIASSMMEPKTTPARLPSGT